jgi:hypothetical protein
MINITFKIYEKMFPESNGILPAFVNINHSELIIDYEVESILGSLIVDEGIDLENIEINTFLKCFKKASYVIANDFITKAINFYFSHPHVLENIQNGRVTIFPNYRSLPDIDYDLLIPVIEKSY